MKLRKTHEDNWTPWVKQRGGKEIRMRRKRNEKKIRVGREERGELPTKAMPRL